MKRETPPWGAIFTAVGIGLATGIFLRKRNNKFAKIDQQIKELAEQEKNETRPFPKSIDLEPAYE